MFDSHWTHDEINFTPIINITVQLSFNIYQRKGNDKCFGTKYFVIFRTVRHDILFYGIIHILLLRYNSILYLKK